MASQYGGAIYSDGTTNGNAALTVTNCTFNQNRADFAYGGIAIDGQNGSSVGIATLLLRNTILRTGAFGANLNNDGGTITSGGHNLSNDAAGGFLTATGDKPNTDPQLNSLANNGGPTDTAGLQPGSMAIDSGNDANAPKLDQRGYLRSGMSDIGAFEFGGAPLRFTSISRLPNGHIVLQGIGVPGALHTIQASSAPAAATFGPIASATANASGVVTYDDAGAVGLTKRFYRLSFP